MSNSKIGWKPWQVRKTPRDRKLIEAQESLMAGMDDVPGQLEEYFTRLLNVRLLIEQADVPMTVPKIFGLSGGLAVAGGLIVVVRRAVVAADPRRRVAFGNPAVHLVGV